MQRKYIYILSGVACVCFIAIGAVLFITNQPKATYIPIGSTLKQAKALSEGDLPACLADNTAASKAIDKDDILLSGKWSAFSTAATNGIIDVPAGTNVETTEHTYDGKVATGTIKYPPKYGTYNFTMVHTSGEGLNRWKLTSLIACN